MLMLLFYNDDIDNIRASMDNLRMLKIAYDYGVDLNQLKTGEDQWIIDNSYHYGVGGSCLFFTLIRLIYSEIGINVDDTSEENKDEIVYQFSGTELRELMREDDFGSNMGSFLTIVHCDYSSSHMEIKLNQDFNRIILTIEDYAGYFSFYLEHIIKMVVKMKSLMERKTVNRA
ncbi:hypothetical protein [Paenibacillus sp. 276b]|uniref:hypothetical protein n=1 Tax=Paenibacillus sp. 276b TaxID=1566277 RepID=UPI00089B0AC7|nr:hypothetical protein [Paenibacillus sp. 276b]SEB27676.1 hypothetical protein SAMN03159332_6353 [Paenibacillus sp. 276b]